MVLLQKKGCPVWQMHARAELKAIKSAVSALPLAEGLQTLMLSLDKAKGKLVVATPGTLFREARVIKSESSGRTSSLARFIGYAMDVRKGNEIFINEDALDVAAPEGFLGKIDIGGAGGMDTPDRIAHILSRTESWRDAKTEELRPEVIGVCMAREAFFRKAGVKTPEDYMQNPRVCKKVNKEAGKALREILRISASISAVTAIAESLTPEEMASLSELERLGSEKARKYLKHSEGAREYGSRRTAQLKTRYGPVCPEALAALREQWEREDRGLMTELSSWAGETIIPAPEPPRRREPSADGYIIETEFPGLYRKMMQPTAQEQELRRLKNLARRLRRSGMPNEEIRSRLETKPGNEKVGDAAASKPAQSKRPKRRQTGPNEALPAKTDSNEKPQQDDRMSRGEFIASVRLSETAQKAITDYGLVPEDVVFSMFKGFNLGAGNSAVGGGHYRGAKIRGNIRRCLAKRYTESPGDRPDVDDMIGFLRSVDLIRGFGSSASTKTKDDAMSLNTGPDNEVGRDIMRTVTAALIELRSR